MRRCSALVLFAAFLASWQSADAQAGCSCTVFLSSGPNNYTAARLDYNNAPAGSCTCGNGAFTGVCQNLGSAAQSQTSNPNGTTTYAAQGTCLQATAQPPTALVLPATPPQQSAVSPPTTAPPTVAPPTASPPSPSTPIPTLPTSSPPTSSPPSPSPPSPSPPSPPPPQGVPPNAAPPPQPVLPPAALPPAGIPPTVQPPSGSPPRPAPPAVPPVPSTPGGIINNNSGNSNITNTNITNISNTVTNINNTVTNNVVTNINAPVVQSTPGTVTPSPPPAAPPTPPTPVTSVTTGASVPPVPVVTPPPAPPTPPQCGVQPQCRIFTEDKLCCQDQGIVSESQYSSTWILCTHSVQLPQSCLSVGGPANLSVSPFFTEGTVGTNFNYALAWNTTAPYIGKVTIDIEQARSVRPECTLNISPCLFNGETVTTVAPVTPLAFSVIQPLAFQLGYVGFPATNLETLDSFAWADPSNSTACLGQSKINLVRGSFGYSAQTFVSQPGYKVPCSPQVTFNAITPNAQQLNTLPKSGVPGIAP